METIDQRAVLSALIRERRDDNANLSRLLGRNPAYMHQFMNKGSPKELADKDRRTLAAYFGVDEAALGGSLVPAFEAPRKLIGIPRFDIGASAGPGSFGDNERPVAHLGFDPVWLRQLCASKPEHLSIIRVQGESMYPTLADGDDIMVDRSEAGSRLTDGIYVLRRDDTLIVKRLGIHPVTGRVTISSDNSSHPSWPDCEPSSINVIGRVVWAGRKIS